MHRREQLICMASQACMKAIGSREWHIRYGLVTGVEPEAPRKSALRVGIQCHRKTFNNPRSANGYSGAMAWTQKADRLNLSLFSLSILL